MKFFNQFKQFLMGMLCMALIGAVTIPVVAASNYRTIQAFFNGIKIYVDDNLISSTDANGNKVEPFVFNGTVYLPVRAVSSALGKAVTWDGKTTSVYIGKHDSSTPSIMLNQLTYFNKSGDEFKSWASPIDNLGKTYTYSLTTSSSGWQNYNINGNYSKVKGKFVLNYNNRDTKAKHYLKIYGDGNVIYSSPVLTGGVYPIDFEIDITGVNRIAFEFTTDNYGNSIFPTNNFNESGIVDVGFYQ